MSEKKFVNKPVQYVRFRKNVVTMPKIHRASGEHMRNAKGDYLAVRIRNTYGYDKVLREWVLVGSQIEDLIPSELGMLKEGKFIIVFRKQDEDKLMRKFYRFFSIDMFVKMPDNKHEFILIKNNMVWYHNLLHSKVALLPNSSRYFKRGDVKELSPRQVAEMFEKKIITQIFEPDLRTVCIFEQLISEV